MKNFKTEIIRGHKVEYGVGDEYYPTIFITLKGETEKIRGFVVNEPYEGKGFGIHTKKGVLIISKSFHEELKKMREVCKKNYKNKQEEENIKIYIERAKKENRNIKELVSITAVFENKEQIGENYNYIECDANGNFKKFSVFMG